MDAEYFLRTAVALQKKRKKFAEKIEKKRAFKESSNYSLNALFPVLLSAPVSVLFYDQVVASFLNI